MDAENDLRWKRDDFGSFGSGRAVQPGVDFRADLGVYYGGRYKI